MLQDTLVGKGTYLQYTLQYLRYHTFLTDTVQYCSKCFSAKHDPELPKASSHATNARPPTSATLLQGHVEAVFFAARPAASVIEDAPRELHPLVTLTLSQ